MNQMNNEQSLKLIDIYDITYHPWWLSLQCKVIIFFIILLIITFTAYFLYKKYSNKKTLSFSERILQKIVLLEKNNKNDVQEIYTELTHILKEYIQHTFHIQVTDKTDTEFLEKIDIFCTKKNMPDSIVQLIKEIFDGVLYIKFAQGKAVDERIKKDISSAKKIIYDCEDLTSKKKGLS